MCPTAYFFMKKHEAKFLVKMKKRKLFSPRHTDTQKEALDDEEKKMKIGRIVLNVVNIIE